jgi:hypothetical protein
VLFKGYEIIQDISRQVAQHMLLLIHDFGINDDLGWPKLLNNLYQRNQADLGVNQQDTEVDGRFVFL